MIGTLSKLQKWQHAGNLDVTGIKLLAFDEADMLFTVGVE